MIVILYILPKDIILAIFMSILTKLKYNIKKSSIIIVSFNFGIFLINSAIYMLKGAEIMGFFFPLTTCLPAFLCFSLVSKYKGFKVLFSLLTVSIFGTLTSYIQLLSSLVFKIYFINLLSQFLSLGLLIFFIMKIFRKRYFEMLEALENIWGLFCTIPLLLLTIIFLLQYYPSSIINRTENIFVVFVVYILVFAFDAIMYLNFKNISEYFQLKQDRKNLLLHTEMQKNEYTALMDKMKATQIYRHDMRHHISAISIYLHDNNFSEAQKYLHKLEDNLNNTIVSKYCDNYGVNVILSTYISRARKEQIKVISTVVLAEQSRVDDLDIGVIFANAIENAINACKKIDDISNRMITITCQERSGQICIQITNTFVGQVNFDGEYPVAHDIEHGFGTKSIATITEKYGGIFSFSIQDGIFKTSVILNVS